MKRIKLIFVAATGVALLAACQATTPQQQNANCAVGTIGGAALGGILGNQIGGGTGNDIATVAGAAAGGLAGSSAACQ
jgi:outer membrane lipoprotein SlyB